jgi:hypothetical protein
MFEKCPPKVPMRVARREEISFKAYTCGVANPNQQKKSQYHLHVRILLGPFSA